MQLNILQYDRGQWTMTIMCPTGQTCKVDNNDHIYHTGQISILDTMRRAMALELRYEVDILKQSIGTTVAATKAAADKNSVEELREIIDALQVTN